MAGKSTAREVYEIRRINDADNFFFNDTATAEIYTLSLHDALPICAPGLAAHGAAILSRGLPMVTLSAGALADPDRKSTRLNSSH